MSHKKAAKTSKFDLVEKELKDLLRKGLITNTTKASDAFRMSPVFDGLNGGTFNNKFYAIRKSFFDEPEMIRKKCSKG